MTILHKIKHWILFAWISNVFIECFSFGIYYYYYYLDIISFFKLEEFRLTLVFITMTLYFYSPRLNFMLSICFKPIIYIMQIFSISSSWPSTTFLLIHFVYHKTYVGSTPLYMCEHVLCKINMHVARPPVGTCSGGIASSI